MIFCLYPLSLKKVCVLVWFFKLVCDLGFSRGLKRHGKAQKGVDWLASANSGFVTCQQFQQAKFG